jgi:hypothetical protein
MAPYKVLYGRRCISPLFEVVVGESSIVGPRWV